jgi:hypothetical protein
MRAFLMSTFCGIGPFAADEIFARAGDGTDRAEALATLMNDVRNERFAPHAILDAGGNTDGVWAFAPASVPAMRRFPRDSVSVALDTLYATRAAHTAEASEQNALQSTLARESPTASAN